MSWTQEAQAFVERYLGVPARLIDEILWTVAIVLVLILARHLTLRVLSRRVDDPARRYIAVKTANYVLGFIAVIALMRVWLGGLAGLAASIGIVSAGLAIALNQPLTNLAGWIFLTVRRPFSVGDRVQIGTFAGDVIDLRLFAFSLVEIGNWVEADQSTGRILHIPNGLVFRETVANYTQGFNFIWNEIPVTITFESDWRKAKELLTDIVHQHTAIQSDQAAGEVQRAASKYLIKYEHLTPIVWTSVADIGVTLTIRYLTDPRRRRSSETSIWEEVLGAFAATDDIDFAYPTQRFFDNVAEGKPGARAGTERDTRPQDG
jgi:small-conductance mechanosensitive channel